MHVGIVVLELIGTGVVLEGFVEGFEIAQAVGDVVVGRGMAWIDLDATLEAGHRFLFALQLVQGIAAVVINICKIGLEFHHHFVGAHRLFQPLRVCAGSRHRC